MTTPRAAIAPSRSNGNVKTGLNNANTAGVRAIGILGLEFQPGASDHYTLRLTERRGG